MIENATSNKKNITIEAKSTHFDAGTCSFITFLFVVYPWFWVFGLKEIRGFSQIKVFLGKKACF